MSQQRMEEIVNMFKNNALGPEDTFDFSCDRCGRCCRNREDILLSPHDLYRIAKYLGKTPKEIVETYCEWYIGDSSRVPIIRLLPKQYRKTCPFLSKDGCSIHPAKPNVCALFPLGRGMEPNKEELVYFLQPLVCGKKGTKHTVKEWMESFGYPVQDQDAIAWMKLTVKLGQNMRKMETRISDENKNLIWTAEYALCYLNYETDRDFTEQFSENQKLLTDYLETCHRFDFSEIPTQK